MTNREDIYCNQIIPGELEVETIKRIPRVWAFYHTRPHWPVHIVVIPTVHVDDLLSLTNEDGLAEELLQVVQEMVAMVTAKEGACRVLTNIGDYQKSKHLHFLVISGDATTDNIV